MSRMAAMSRIALRLPFRGIAPFAALAGAALLLVACGKKDNESEAPSAADAALAEANASLDLPALPAVPSQERVDQAMSVILLDPKSARYSNLRNGAGGAICGEVDSKQPNGRHGGPRPFVITPEGVGVVSTTASVSFDDPSEIFPDFYIRYCASPEELQRLGPGLQRALTSGVDSNLAFPEIPDLPDLAGPVPAANAPASQPAPRSEPAAPPPRSTNSFSDAVLRKKDQPPGK